MRKRQGSEVQGKQAVGPHESSRPETTRLRLIPADGKAAVRPEGGDYSEVGLNDSPHAIVGRPAASRRPPPPQILQAESEAKCSKQEIATAAGARRK